MKKIPLKDIVIACDECKDTITGEELNQRNNLHHRVSDGVAILLPMDGLTEEQVKDIPTVRCECCQEDYEEKHG